MKIFLTNLLLVITLFSNAQAPWRAKLFVHFLDSNNQIVTDTVWFGCDSLGAEGFQPGLDVIDTNLQWNKVYSADEIIKSQFNTDCANMKTNIIGFKKKESSFKFYAIGNPISISWDTLDFMYFDTIYRLSYTEIRTANGYINNIDQRYYNVTEDNYKIIGGQYIFNGFWVNPNDSVKLLPESLHGACVFSNYAFEFNINLIMGPRFINGIYELVQQGVLNVYPNPFSNKLMVYQIGTADFSEIILYDMHGKELFKKPLENDVTLFDTANLPAGIYYMTFMQNNNSKLYKPFKLIKL
ncbi:MAG: T9SS type A sorting domain-containing protein [Bacteroidia bacterium]|nr:T9SS type A sorting domain-containing protein [Bacteroidia bacterium]